MHLGQGTDMRSRWRCSEAGSDHGLLKTVLRRFHTILIRINVATPWPAYVSAKRIGMEEKRSLPELGVGNIDRPWRCQIFRLCYIVVIARNPAGRNNSGACMTSQRTRGEN